MITDLRLQNFRSYSDEAFELSDGVNIIVGPNASGKTNLLEAILVLARGNSYRVKDSDLIKFNQPWARLDGDLSDGKKRTVKIVTEPKPDKTYELDDRLYKRLTLPNTLPVVLFEPNHLQLLSGSPERRRDYIDDLLEQTVPGYGAIRRNYRRTLAQRNALLKKPGTQLITQVFPWNVRLSELAGKIVRERNQLISNLNERLPGLYKSLSGTGTNIKLVHECPWPADVYESHFIKKLETNLELDRVRGFTGSGPHREDIAVLFDERPATETASRGETRTTVLALKVLELQIIETARAITPLLLLDDVFSELDGKRRHALTNFLSSYQTFITTTDADLVLQHFTDAANIIPTTR